jgi:hypothetical protein
VNRATNLVATGLAMNPAMINVTNASTARDAADRIRDSSGQ